MRYVMCFFPLVGVVTGPAIWCWLWLCRQFGVGAPLAAVVCTALPVLVSGGIHLDGFCDTVDALASHASRERKLEILRDPHTGAFAVMGCCLYLLILFGLWMQHVFSPRATAALCIGFVQSRVLSGLSVVTFPCAKTSGLAAQFANAAHRARVRTVLITFARRQWLLVRRLPARPAARRRHLYLSGIAACRFGSSAVSPAIWQDGFCSFANWQCLWLPCWFKFCGYENQQKRQRRGGGFL